MAKAYDLVLRGGTVVDGTGAEPRKVDVALRGDRVAEVGKVEAEPETPTLDVSGLVVTPGFIDVNAHEELVALAYPRGEAKLRSGFTTEILGNGGRSAFPLGEGAREAMEPEAQRLGVDLTWSTVDDFLRRMADRGTGPNRAFLLGHSTLHGRIVGLRLRPAGADELNAMHAEVDRALDAGCLGMSLGLHRPTGGGASRIELLNLARQVAEAGGILAVHLRNEGDALEEALEEALELAEQTGCALHINRIKTARRRNWQKLDWLEQRLEQAIAGGINLTADRYPYVADNPSLVRLLPPWALEGGTDSQLQRLQDPVDRQKIMAELNAELDADDYHRLLISRVADPALQDCVGRRVDEIAADWNLEPIEALFELLMRDNARTRCIRFFMSSANLARIMSWPFVMVSSDAAALAVDNDAAGGLPHPRAFGTPARFLRRFVREDEQLSLPRAVRKLSGLPAERFGLQDRGILCPGAFADIVCFDPDEVRDTATFKNPASYCEGIPHVLVNGQFAVRDGESVEGLPGRILRKG